MFFSPARAKYFLFFAIFFFGLIFLNLFSAYLIKKNHRPIFTADEYPGEYQVSTLIVPHHKVVKDIRQKFLQEFASARSQPNTVVLLSPDHFSTNQKQISFTDKTWNLSNGKLDYDHSLGPDLTAGLNNDQTRVEKDHGIYNILPDIKTYFPQARVVPITIGQQVAFEDLAQLQKNIDTFCQPSDCVLIGSVDFSHYLPLALANVHDQTTYRALMTGVLNTPRDIEVDTPQSLFVLMNHAKTTQLSHFELYNHTNSLEIAGNPDAESTSHIFGWFDQLPATQNIHPVTPMSPLSQNKELKTFTYAVRVQEKNEATGLGERFFYGTDALDTHINQTVSVTPQLSITPLKRGKGGMKFDAKKNLTTIFLSDDMAVAGTTDGTTTSVVLLPMKLQKFQHIFLRDKEKTQRLQTFFNGLKNSNTLQLNKENGTITISAAPLQ